MAAVHEMISADRMIRLAASLIAFACVMLAWPVRAEQFPAPRPKDLAEWIQQLQLDDAEKRDAAMENLRQAGEDARGTLETAALSANHNLQRSAYQLLAALDTRPVMEQIEAAISVPRPMEAEVVQT